MILEFVVEHADEAGFRARVGARLKDARNRLRLTAEVVAEQMGVSRQSVVNWESGRQLPAGPKMVQLANLYTVSVDQLFGRLEPGDDSLLLEEAELALRSASDQLTEEDVRAIRDFIRFVHSQRRQEGTEVEDDEGFPEG